MASRHLAVKNAIALSRGDVSVSLMQWAGPDQQAVSVPWTLLKSGRQADAFAAFVDAVERGFPDRRGTAIGNALEQARQHMTDDFEDCRRSVLDISGDGASNAGINTALEADALAFSGVTINGLVLPSKIGKQDDPYIYYVRHVARGAGSFVMDVASYEDFPRAFQRKLLREIQMQLALAE